MKAILLRRVPSFFSCSGDAARKLSVCESGHASVNESNTVPLFDTSLTPWSQMLVDRFPVCSQTL